MGINNSKSILIIEDNPGDYALVEAFLLEQNELPKISHAPDFNTAKNILAKRSSNFDVILLDLSLPDKIGLVLIEEITGLCPNTPVIVLTGYADFNFGIRSLSLGITDFILKDELTPLTLYKSIAYSIERKKAITALESSESQVRNFAKHLNGVLEDERSRIAREIHDEFGQQLSGLKMSIASLRKFEGRPDELEPIVDLMITDINTSLSSLRQIANELRPVLLDKFGLFAAIQWLVSDFEIKNQIVSSFSINGDQPEIDEIVKINIYRICQEALTNISKHAKATVVNVEVTKAFDSLVVKIIDNGSGIISADMHHPLSMGLLSMKERAYLIGAEFKIISSSKKGTTIELKLPSNEKKDLNSRRSFRN